MVTNEDKVLFTRDGLKALKEEYRRLIENRRPTVVERLADARQTGDLAENSEYLQAREELAFIDGRIRGLEELMRSARVIKEEHENCREVKLGCLVTVADGKNQYVFHLVGEWEADPAEAKISSRSPLGHSLLGKKIGEEVEVKAPAGKVIYKIIEIN